MLQGRRQRRTVMVALGAIALVAKPCGAVTWLPIARDGGPAPGVPNEPGAEFAILTDPVVNNSSRVAFRAYLDAFSLDHELDTDTVWSGNPGQLQLAMREGAAAPGTTEEFESFWDEIQVNNAGQLLVAASVSGPINRSDGVWLGTPGNMQLLARTNTALPGLPQMLDDINQLSMALGDGGHAAFLGRDVNDKFGLWTGTPGNLVVAAIEDGPVPSGQGLAAGTVFGSFLPPTNTATINASGAVAFLTTVDGPSYFGDAIWTGAPGNLKLIAREDQAAPGLPGTEFFLLTSSPLINGPGQVAFKSTLSNLDESIWRGTQGNLQLVARSGNAAPVGTAAAVFREVGGFDELRFNDAGQIGFHGSFEGPGITLDNNEGIFVTSGTSMSLVARTGGQAPGMSAGAVFDFIQDYSMNAAGRMAFVATVRGGGVTASNDSGIWAQDAAGELQLVVRTGDWVHPTTGVVVRMSDAGSGASMRGQGYGQIDFLSERMAQWTDNDSASAWNSAGQVAFTASLDHPTVIEASFLASVGAATEPGDFNADGDVDGADFLVWQREDRTPTGLTAWRTSYGVGAAGAGMAVPEPRMLALSLWGAAAGMTGGRCASRARRERRG